MTGEYSHGSGAVCAPKHGPFGYAPRVQVILRALQKYGMIVADNGSDWFLSGVADARWNATEINTLKQLRGSDFEVVRMVGVVTP